MYNRALIASNYIKRFRQQKAKLGHFQKNHFFCRRPILFLGFEIFEET